MSRIAPLVGNLIGSESADELLVDIMGALGDSVESIPEVGKIYVFAYQPSTPNTVSYTHLTLPTTPYV